mgnify:CR=1 FL=1
MSAENQAERKKFNFEEMISLAIDRDRQIRASPFLQGKLSKLNENQFESDDDFYNSDEEHHYEDPADEYGLNPQEEELEPEVDSKAQVTELVKTVEEFIGSNYNEQENPEVFMSFNQLMSCFYDFKARGKAGPNFASCILELYRKLKTNKSTSLANQYTTESIFDTLEELNQLIGSMGSNSVPHNSFSPGY